MSLLSDIRNTLNFDDSGTQFNVFEYSEQNNAEIAFSITGVFSISRSQMNKVPDKPLEGGDFANDSRNIIPYTLQIDGAIMEENGISIENILNIIDGYLNGITLLQIVPNEPSGVFSVYSPLILVGKSDFTTVDSMIPNVRLTFKQVIVANDSDYFNNQTSNANDIRNRPVRDI